MRSRTCDTIFRRNAFLFFFSSFFSYLESLSHLFFATISTLWHITFAIAIFISRVYILNYHRLHAIKIQTNRFILSLSFIPRSLSLSFLFTIFPRFLHLHTRYNKIHIHECHSVVSFSFFLCFLFFFFYPI